jgi:hypothetical protein
MEKLWSEYVPLVSKEADIMKLSERDPGRARSIDPGLYQSFPGKRRPCQSCHASTACSGRGRDITRKSSNEV